MRKLRTLDKYRRTTQDVIDRYGSTGDDRWGVFDVPSVIDRHFVLKVLASTGGDWDHVSVSLPHRIPAWVEMQQIHRLFFRDDEIAFELHMPAKDHINNHPNVLHLWRPKSVEIPLPPK